VILNQSCGTRGAALSGLERARDSLAGLVKGELEAAAFRDQPVHGAIGQTVACQALIRGAQRLAGGS
jgi:hypothetical protein